MIEKIKSLFCDDNKSAFEIAEMLKISQEEVVSTLNSLGIKKISDRKYYILKATPFTKTQKEFIYGCLLGTGQLKKYGKRSCYYLHVEEPDRNVVLWKKLNLANYVNLINKNSQDGWWFNTVDHNELNTVHKKFYDNNKKIITEDIINDISSLSLAVLFLDRGVVKPAQTIRFNTSHLSLSSHEALQRVFKLNLNINSKVCCFIRNGAEFYYLSLNKRNSKLFMDAIRSHLDEINKG